MRISANGIDPGVAVAQGATTPPCFPLGVPAPGLSGQFNILNQAQNTNTYPDKYGPWSNGGLRGGGRGVMLVVSLLTLAALLL